jgi:hypothetical protein
MKNKVDELIKKLENNKDVVILSGYDSDNPGFNYYHSITGTYKEKYFCIYTYKVKGYSPDFEISENITEKTNDFKKFLETLTELKFTLV